MLQCGINWLDKFVGRRGMVDYMYLASICNPKTSIKCCDIFMISIAKRAKLRIFILGKKKIY